MDNERGSSSGGSRNGSGQPTAPPRGNKPNYVQQTRAQVDEVVDIMKTNVEKVIERDLKLSELDQRADTLAEGANQFEKKAVRLKRKLWWKNIKLMAIIIGVAILFIVLVFYLGI